MRRFQSILYVTRGTADESDALRQAVNLARNNAAALHAVVVSPATPRNLGEYKADYDTFVADRLRASIANARAALQINSDEFEATVEVERSDMPALFIVRRVLRNAHDLLVKQTEPVDQDTGFRALDMQLLRQCPCPVWLCRPLHPSTTGIRVGVAIDPRSAKPAGRDLALQLLRVSRSLTDAASRALDIMSCWDFAFENDLRHSPWAKASEASISSAVITAERDHLEALKRLIDESGIPDPFRVRHTRGRPEQVIPQLVDDLQIDTLVMGTVARTGISGLIMGNTAENVLREIRCSLLALKPNGFVSPVRAYG